MNRGAVADLARFKIAHSLWSVTRAGPYLRGFEAKRNGVVVQAATLAELAQRITEVERNPPS